MTDSRCSSATEQLLPCPFCGYNDPICHEEDGKFCVVCGSVECYVAIGEAYDRDAMPVFLFHTIEDAIKAWNTRASPTPQAQADDWQPIKAILTTSKNRIPSNDIRDYSDGGKVEMLAKEIAGVGGARAGETRPIVSIKPMQLADGRPDYFVSIKVGDREVTPHVFREEYKAAFHVALYDWLLNGSGEEPDVVEFGPDDWPAQSGDVAQRPGDSLAGLVERLDRLCLTSTEDRRRFVLATESARNIVEIVREWIRSGAGYSVPSTDREGA